LLRNLFFPAKKLQDERWEEVLELSQGYPVGGRISQAGREIPIELETVVTAEGKVVSSLLATC
jgi:hypothetical protein